MAKAACGGYANRAATQEVPHPRGWQQTPKWHYRYWFGYRMRIAVGFSNGVSPWAYRSHAHHARVVLEAQAHGIPLASYDPPGANSSRSPKR